MTSSNGNIFRVTGPLCGEFANNREAGDLRRHLGHYDVNVMGETNTISKRSKHLELPWSHYDTN